MPEYRKGAHTVYDIQYHFVWVTKYRYKVLRGETAERAREIIRQVCMSREVTILKGHVSADHVHLMVSCPPTLAPAQIAQYIKGVSSRKLQDEFPLLKKRYWGQHLWARGYFCGTVGAVTKNKSKPTLTIIYSTPRSRTSVLMSDFQSYDLSGFQPVSILSALAETATFSGCLQTPQLMLFNKIIG